MVSRVCVVQYYSYDSDITCSYPANGHFTADQKVSHCCGHYMQKSKSFKLYPLPQLGQVMHISAGLPF